MRYDVPRWLCDLARALEEADTAVDAPGGDIGWHLSRCRDTTRMHGDLRARSLEDLVQSLAAMLREYPTAIPDLLLHAAMAAPGTAFAFALLRMEALALGLPGAPRWGSVIISGPLEFFPTQPTPVTPSDLVSADAFAERFDQLLSLGFPWISLSAAGLFGGALLVIVETPTYTQPYPEVTSVNASGPPAAVRQRADWRIDDLVVIEGAP